MDQLGGILAELVDHATAHNRGLDADAAVLRTVALVVLTESYWLPAEQDMRDRAALQSLAFALRGDDARLRMGDLDEAARRAWVGALERVMGTAPPTGRAPTAQHVAEYGALEKTHRLLYHGRAMAFADEHGMDKAARLDAICLAYAYLRDVAQQRV